MVNVKFLHQPGYLYDLISIFVLRYNKELLLECYTNSDDKQKDLAYIRNITEEFSIENEDLSIFFAEDEVKGSFFLKKYFFEYEDKMISDYDFDFLVSEILDKNIFAQRLLDFYLPNTELVVDFEERSFIEDLAEQINETYYTEKTKNKLLTFFISPDKFLMPLIKEISDKNAILTKYYQKNFKRIVEIQEGFDFAGFKDKLFKIDEQTNCKELDFIYISICLVCKNIIEYLRSDNACLILVGSDYEETLNKKYSNKSKLEIDVFGKIISDQNRIDIIKMLAYSPELSTSSIAKNLGISINAAYYHLDMMCQANMLSVRNEGRTVFYRFNKRYISKVIESISRIFVKK